jgi:hypothetical protein
MSHDRAVNRDVLAMAMESLVPLWAARARSWTPERLAAERDATAWVIACGGDALFTVMDDPPPGDMRLPTPDVLTGEQIKEGVVARNFRRGEILNALAKGLAMGSLLPGGVTFLDLHWCSAPHKGCPRGRAA